MLVLVLGFLLRESWPLLGDAGFSRLFTEASWHPQEDRFGLLPMLWATLAAALGAALLPTPLGVADVVRKAGHGTLPTAKCAES